MSLVELRLGDEPDAAARARAVVSSALEGAEADLRESARLIVTELVTNAQLHGSAPVSVGLRPVDSGWRLEVGDAGRGQLVLPVHSLEAMTGRGLGLVAALCKDWGVMGMSGGGKAVWALLVPGHVPVTPEPGMDLDAMLESWEDDGETEPLFDVHLGAVPTDLLLDAKRHIDNVVRELTLERAAARERPMVAEVAALVETVTKDFSLARAGIKRQAASAASRGDVETELNLRLPASSAAAGERYLAALDDADRYARSARLLTLETPPTHRVFRRWYVQALVDQLRALSAGRQPAPQRTFVQVLGDEVASLSSLRETAHRLALLQQVNAELTARTSARELAEVVVRVATRSLGAVSARVHLREGDELVTLASDGSALIGERAERVALDAELPAAAAYRDNEAVLLATLAQAHERFPGLGRMTEVDRSVHVAPLTVGPHRLGVLSIVFAVDGRLGQDDQNAFVRALADALAQALERHQAEKALRSERDIVQSLHQVGQAVTARLEINEVVQTVTDAATRMTGAQFGAFFYNVPDDSGGSYQLYALSGMSRESFDAFPVPRNTAVFAPTFVGEGIVRLDDVTVDERFGLSAPHFGLPAGHLPVRSYLAVPVVLNDGEVVGGLFFGHEQPAVFDEDDERLAEGIVAYARIALENGRLYDAARREFRLKQRVVAALERPLRPPTLPVVPGVELLGSFQPFGGEGGLGGDFFDAFPVPGGGWLVALGDVSGKGPEAAAVTGLVRDTLWAAAQHGDDVCDVLQVVNAALMRQDSGRFATLVAGVLTLTDDGVAYEAAWAGHPPAVVVRANGQAQLVQGIGMPLGMFDEADLQTLTLTLSAGDTLLLHTDGLTERQGAVLGDEDLIALVAEAEGESLEGLLQHLLDAVDARYPRRDDIALLGLRVGGHERIAGRARGQL